MISIFDMKKILWGEIEARIVDYTNHWVMPSTIFYIEFNAQSVNEANL